MTDDKLKRFNAFFQDAADAVLAGQGDRLASALEAAPSSGSLVDRPSYGERYDRALERRQSARSSMEDAYPAESMLGRLIGFGVSPIPKTLAIPAGIAGAVSGFKQNNKTPLFDSSARPAYPEATVPQTIVPEPVAQQATKPVLAPSRIVPTAKVEAPKGPFPSLSALSVPEDVLSRTSSDQPLVQWADAEGVTHLVNNPKYRKKEEQKKPFIPPRVAVVQALKKHGVDSEYALEQLEQNPQAIGELLSDLISAGKDSQTLSFVLPALGRSSNNDLLNAILVAKNTGQNPEDVLRGVLYDTPDPQAPGGYWPGVLSATEAPEGKGEGSNAWAHRNVRMMSAIARSFLDEARGKTPQAYRPTEVLGGWTGGGGVPMEQTKT
jgi:hypothetical protein